MMTERGWDFYEYSLSRTQMRAFLGDAGLEIVEEFVEFGDEGILHNFGRISGTYDPAEARVRLSPVGRVLRRALPVDLVGHMLSYLVRRPAAADAPGAG
jgi:hypothetical protein